MEWVIAAIVVALLGLAALAGTGALGQLRPEPVRDVYRQPLPDRALTPNDLDAVRFAVSVRGYSMGQVDELLDRLRNELVVLQTELADARSSAAALPAVEDSDPFAEYQLDGGQGLPEVGPWHDGDGRPGVTVEDEGPNEFRQFALVTPDGAGPDDVGPEDVTHDNVTHDDVTHDDVTAEDATHDEENH